ncbi:hypothetical protein [Parerythrobacter lacustris]|uniref:DUF3619 family protein n=1 Tax=Parerythrobacter lacustris TaxID=2969984 RepID=A0ABT1XQQ6_9SPHN|nr:hypothetical protein [Parerythrobacter lacustris]MCR2833937.1 hypothetical protein [Parerythrobacter lacustris]
MSLSLERQFAQDRALRDAAFALLKADVSHLRTDISAEGLMSRFAGRMSEGAIDVYEDAAEIAENNRGLLVALIAALVLWFAREPILSLLGEDDEDDDHETGAQPQEYDGELM